MIDTSPPPSDDRRLVSHPDRLSLPDLHAILDQAADPGALYKLDTEERP